MNIKSKHEIALEALSKEQTQGRDGHFRILNPEGSKSQTIRNPNSNINRISGTGFKSTQLR